MTSHRMLIKTYSVQRMRNISLDLLRSRANWFIEASLGPYLAKGKFYAEIELTSIKLMIHNRKA